MAIMQSSYLAVSFETLAGQTELPAYVATNLLI